MILLLFNVRITVKKKQWQREWNFLNDHYNEPNKYILFLVYIGLSLRCTLSLVILLSVLLLPEECFLFIRIRIQWILSTFQFQQCNKNKSIFIDFFPFFYLIYINSWCCKASPLLLKEKNVIACSWPAIRSLIYDGLKQSRIRPLNY